MPIEDQEPKSHRVSSPEDRERLLAAALAHAEHQEAVYRTPSADAEPVGRWKASLSVVLLILAAFVGLAPPGWLSTPPPQVSDVQHENGERTALRVLALQVEVFRYRNGRLPDALDELPRSLPSVRYVRSNNRVFQLVTAGPNGEAIIFDSARPDSTHDAFVAGLAGEGDS